jgi:hypothetical protein
MYNDDDKRWRDGPVQLPHGYESEKRIWWDGRFYEDMTEFYRAPDKSLAPTTRLVDVKNSTHDYRMKRSMTGDLTEYDSTHIAMATKMQSKSPSKKTLKKIETGNFDMKATQAIIEVHERE